jgi:hypothetical protein
MARTEVPMAIAPMKPSDLSITADGIEIGRIQSWEPVKPPTGVRIPVKRKFRFIAGESK